MSTCLIISLSTKTALYKLAIQLKCSIKQKLKNCYNININKITNSNLRQVRGIIEICNLPNFSSRDKIFFILYLRLALKYFYAYKYIYYIMQSHNI